MNLRGGTAMLLLLGLVAGCSRSVVNGSGQIVSEDRPVSGFDAVTLAGNGEMVITQGETEALTIEADDNILPHIQSEVRGTTLVIQYDRDNWDTIYRPSQRIKYNLTVKSLSALALSGSGDISAAALTADRLTITVSGSGDVRVDDLETNALTYVLSGSGEADLAGQAAQQDLLISGSGTYRAGDLASQAVTVSISGSGDATVWVQESLDASISGSGSVSYYGGPEVQMEVGGSGNVNSLGDK